MDDRKTRRLAAVAAGAVLTASWGLTGSPAAAADAAHPTVVELFQSQGCSSCPPANANLMNLTGRRDVLALAFAVDYWDRLGWKDTFANPRFTARQYAYRRALGLDSVYTPQVVVNGRVEGVGAEPDDMVSLVARGDRGAGGPSLTVARGAVEVGGGDAPGGGAEVWLARYDPRVVEVQVSRGENAGRRLPHRNVVRELALLGRWTGPPARFDLPASPDPALREAVIVQGAGAGPIMAAASD